MEAKKLRFLLEDVHLEIAGVRQEVRYPVFTDGYHTIGRGEFSIEVEDVGWFYARDGNYVSIVPSAGAEESLVELYLNGSVYGAILHQRGILPMHGSCFRYKGKTIMICGDAGAGKSSITVAFCLQGAGFLTDDVSPVILNERKPHIPSLPGRLKLWRDTLMQLDMNEDGLQRIDSETDKYYYTISREKEGLYGLDIVYLIVISDTPMTYIEELTGSEKFAALRNEVYRPEYLQGMPENEPVFFRNMVDISNAVQVYRVSRPSEIPLMMLRDELARHLASLKGHGR